MRQRLIWLVVGAALLAAGYLGGRASYAADERKHYTRDAAEMDRTQELLVGRIRAMNEKLKMLASAVTFEKLNDPDKTLEKDIGKTLEPVFADKIGRAHV